MIILQHWFTMEVILIISVFAFILLRLVRSVKQRRAKPVDIPKTLRGRVTSSIFYVMRILAVGLGAFLSIAFVVIIERNIYSVLTESMPAPSEVSLPPDLPFEMEEIEFAGGEGLMMAGWNVPSKNGATIILLHGYGTNRTAMLWHAKRLVDAGYGVLLYDERASGESAGTRRSYGWEDPRDVQGAIRFIEAESGGDGDPQRIGIAGCSIGAQIALQSAAYYPELQAVWADGPSTVRAKDIPAPKDPIVALIKLGNYSLDWMFALKLDMEAPAPLIDIIGEIAPRPIMLIGGGRPMPLVGSEGERMVPRYAAYAGANAQTWVIPEAIHCDGPNYRPDEYAERMIEFFDIAMGITR